MKQSIAMAAFTYTPWRESDEPAEPLTAGLPAQATWKQLLDDSRSRIDQLTQLRQQTGHNLRAGALFLQNLNQRRQEVSQLTGRFGDLEQRVLDQLLRVTDQADESQRIINALNQRLATAEQHHETDRSAIADLQRSLAAAGDRFADLREALDADRRAMGKTIRALDERLATAEQRAEDAGQHRVAADARMDDLVDSHHATQTQVQWLAQSQTATDRRAEVLDQRLDDLNQQTSRTGQHLGVLDQRSASLRDDLVALTDRLAQRDEHFTQVLEAAAAERQALRGALADHRGAAEAEWTAVRRQLDAVARLTARLEQAADRLAARAEAQDQQLQSHIAETREHRDQALGRIGHLEQQTCAIDSRTDNLPDQIDRLSAALDTVADDLASARTVAGRLRDRVEAFADESTQQSNRIVDEQLALGVRIDNLQHGLAQVASHVDASTGGDGPDDWRIDELKSQIAHLGEALEQMAVRTGQFRMKLESVEQVAYEAPERAADQTLRIGQLQDELASLSTRLAEHCEADDERPAADTLRDSPAKAAPLASTAPPADDQPDSADRESTGDPAAEHRGYHRDRIDDNKAVPFARLLDQFRQDAA